MKGYFTHSRTVALSIDAVECHTQDIPLMGRVLPLFSQYSLSSINRVGENRTEDKLI